MKAPLLLRALLIGTACLCSGIIRAESVASTGAVERPGWVPGISPRLTITDCVKVLRDERTGVASIDRVLPNPRGYRWDAPGGRVRFRTDSKTVAVHLNFSAKHIGPARNSIGFYRIDDRGTDSWRFARPTDSKTPGDAQLVLPLPVPAGTARFHDYELILPYGDAVEVQGVAVAPEARWEAPAPRPKTRWVAFGDSVTQGFTASSVAATYPFIVGENKNWQVINAGLGGQAAQASDGAFLAGLDAEVFSVAVGVNNWQGGTEPDAYRAQLLGLLQRLRRGKPSVRIYVISPLWVPSAWKPATVKYPLEDYRKVVEEVVAGLADSRIQVIDGASLIDHDPALFDQVAVHPNDKGFAQMAERLAKILER